MGSLRKNPARGRGVLGGRPDKVKQQDTGKAFGRGKPKPVKPIKPWGKGV